MERLPVVHKTKLSKEQTYFVNVDDLTRELADCRCIGDLVLRFSDDPSEVKSAYERFVRQERKLAVLTASFAPWPDVEPEDGAYPSRYAVTVFAMVRSIRNELRAQFSDVHFSTLKTWLNEKRDATWQKKPHSISFLIELDDEEISVVHDLSFEEFVHRGKDDGPAVRRLTIRRH